jgi:4-hydroxy-tetrahydrodipicolinate reductase
MTATDPASLTPAATANLDVRVVVAGPDGRMGQVLSAGLAKQPGITVVGGLRRGDAVAETLTDADVLVDFTHPDSAPDLLLAAIDAGVRPVSGTSNIPESALDAIDAAARARGIAAVWASNYRLAGALLMHLAGVAARFLDAVEIVECHHAGKADAPSGTAAALARRIRAAHGSDLFAADTETIAIPGVRGGTESGVRIHSIRLPGVLGWHELTFAGDDELLVIRHDEYGRDAYVGTVGRAIRKVTEPGLVGLVRGYDAVLGLNNGLDNDNGNDGNGASSGQD